MIYKKLSLSLLLIMMTAIPEQSRTEYYRCQEKLSKLEGNEKGDEKSQQGAVEREGIKKTMDDIYSKLSLTDKLLVNAENHKKKLLGVLGVAAVIIYCAKSGCLPSSSSTPKGS